MPNVKEEAAAMTNAQRKYLQAVLNTCHFTPCKHAVLKQPRAIKKLYTQQRSLERKLNLWERKQSAYEDQQREEFRADKDVVSQAVLFDTAAEARKKLAAFNKKWRD